MKILLAGDIVGGPGRRWFAEVVRDLKARGEIQAVVANAENCAGGSGITVALAKELTDAGADALTLGDHTWGQKELEGTIGQIKNLARPANYLPAAPGTGCVLVQTPLMRFYVVNLQGQVFMEPVDNPFLAIDRVLAGLPRNIPVIVDFHAEATSEKISMGYYLDGRVAAVVGTHTHVQTSDATILPKGTAYLTDLGMTGPSYSTLGREPAPVLKKFTTGMRARFDVARGPCKLEGAILELDRESGKAVSIAACRFMQPGANDSAQ